MNTRPRALENIRHRVEHRGHLVCRLDARLPDWSLRIRSVLGRLQIGLHAISMFTRPSLRMIVLRVPTGSPSCFQRSWDERTDLPSRASENPRVLRRGPNRLAERSPQHEAKGHEAQEHRQWATNEVMPRENKTKLMTSIRQCQRDSGTRQRRQADKEPSEAAVISLLPASPHA